MKYYFFYSGMYRLQGVGNRPGYSTLPIAIPVQGRSFTPYSSIRPDLNKKKISGLVAGGGHGNIKDR